MLSFDMTFTECHTYCAKEEKYGKRRFCRAQGFGWLTWIAGSIALWSNLTLRTRAHVSKPFLHCPRVSHTYNYGFPSAAKIID